MKRQLSDYGAVFAGTRHKKILFQAEPAGMSDLSLEKILAEPDLDDGLIFQLIFFLFFCL